jgi:hypothetical protein
MHKMQYLIADAVEAQVRDLCVVVLIHKMYQTYTWPRPPAPETDLQTGEPPHWLQVQQFEWGEDWQCTLCKKHAGYEHMQSDGHAKQKAKLWRVGQPVGAHDYVWKYVTPPCPEKDPNTNEDADWLQVKQLSWGEDWYCIMCNKHASAGHLLGQDHAKKKAHRLWDKTRLEQAPTQELAIMPQQGSPTLNQQQQTPDWEEPPAPSIQQGCWASPRHAPTPGSNCCASAAGSMDFVNDEIVMLKDLVHQLSNRIKTLEELVRNNCTGAPSAGASYSVVAAVQGNQATVNSHAELLQ